MGDAEPHDVLGRLAVDALAGKADLAGRKPYHHVAEGAQGRGLAGAVGAQERGDAALLDRKRELAQHLRRAVGGVELARLEDRRHHALPR